MGVDVSGYHLFLQRVGRSHTTIKKHLILLGVLQRELEVWDKYSVDKLILALSGRIKNSATNKYIEVIRSYAKYAQIKELTNYPYLKKAPVAKAIMSDSEIEEFLNIPKPYNYGDIHEKWTLFFEIIAYSGMRCGEVANLTVDDLNFGIECFVLEMTKTRTPRNVPMAPHLVPKLKEYIKTLSDKHLFITSKGQIFTEKAWYHQFKKRLEILGIKRHNLSPHSFRHSFIVRMLPKTDLFVVQKIVGHRKLESTAQYMHLTLDDMKEAIKKDPLSRDNLDPKDLMELVAESIKSYKLHKDARFRCQMNENSDSLKFEVNLKCP